MVIGHFMILSEILLIGQISIKLLGLLRKGIVVSILSFVLLSQGEYAMFTQR